MPRLGIQFGIPLTSNQARVVLLLNLVAFSTGVLVTHLHRGFSEVEKSILRSRNVTVAEGLDMFFCDLPYTSCLCPPSANKSSIPEQCITHTQLIISRISSLLTYLLEVCLIYKLFSLNGDYHRVVVYALWLVSLLAFIGITLCIFWSSCLHSYISYFGFATGTLLWLLTVSNGMLVHKRLYPHHYRRPVVVNSESQTDN